MERYRLTTHRQSPLTKCVTVGLQSLPPVSVNDCTVHSSTCSKVEAQRTTFTFVKLHVRPKTVERLIDGCRNFERTGTVVLLIRYLEDVCLSTTYQAYVYDTAMPHNFTACSLLHKWKVCKFSSIYLLCNTKYIIYFVAPVKGKFIFLITCVL